jgi:uncharacterized protein YjbJ (UPF0337 family)
MNTFEINNDFRVAISKLKQRWTELTDGDLVYMEGEGVALYARIQKRTGATREAIEKATTDLFSRF